MTKQELEARLGKSFQPALNFYGDGTDFSAITDAQSFLNKNGFSYGSMQRDAPIGVAKGDVDISKWRNLGDDVTQLDGALVSDDFRNGSVTLYLTMKVG